MPDQTPQQSLKDLLTAHVNDKIMVAYHDQTLDDEAMRLSIAIHLEICAGCRKRCAEVHNLHLSDAEIMHYCYGQLTNASTLARVRAHLEEQHCPLCLSRLEECQEAAQVAETWWAQCRPDSQPATTAPLSITDTWETLTAGAASVWQRLKEAALQPGYLCIEAPHGLVPATGPRWRRFDTPPESLQRESADGALVGIIEEAYDGGVLIILGSEDAAYAGRLLEFVCVAQETDQILLKGFSVLPDTPDVKRCYQSYVHIPSAETSLSDGPLAVHVYRIEPTALTADDLDRLQASMRYAAAEDISHAAWRTFCQRLQANEAISQELRAWAAQQIA